MGFWTLLDWFQKDFNWVSERSDTIRAFRRVLEGSETIGAFRRVSEGSESAVGFATVSEGVVSGGFQTSETVSGFKWF